MTSPDLPPELVALLQAVDTCEREAASLVGDMSEPEVNWQERPGQTWSVAQCLDHLATTNRFYVSGFLARVAHARGKGVGPFAPLTYTPGARWFVNTLEPPVRQRVKARPQVVPRETIPLEGLVEAFRRSHDPYRELVAAAADVDVNRVTGPNPFFKIIPMRVSTVLRVIPAHDRRHLWQAANVRRALRGA
jgi:hypothetical protein